jgi:hypothetical protein
VHEQVAPEGFDKDQERRLKSKKKSQIYQTEDEKWKSVYRILFPDDAEADIPTPYIDYQPCIGHLVESSHVMRFQQFSRLELPRLVRRNLEAVVEQEAQPLEEKLKERLVDIVKECQTQLVAMFQTIDGPSIVARSSDNLPAAILPTTSQVSAAITQPSTHAVGYKAIDMFDGFDSVPPRATVPSPANALSDFQMPSTMPKLPASSNSSDSGYDSTWPVGQTNVFDIGVGDPTWPVATSFGRDEYLDWGAHSEHNHNAVTGDASASTPAPTLPLHLNISLDPDPSPWTFLEPLPGISDNNGMGTNYPDDLGIGWHI